MTNGADQTPLRSSRVRVACPRRPRPAAVPPVSASGSAEEPAQVRPPLDGDQLLAQGVDRPAAQPPTHLADVERRRARRALAVRGRLVGDEADPQVGGHRVEAAGVHDPRTGRPRGLVRPGHAVAGEERLPGQVGVVGPVLRAGRDDRQPRAGVRADRRDQHPGPSGQPVERPAVGDVDGDELPGGGGRTEVVPQSREAFRGTTRQRDPYAGRCRAQQMGCRQPPDEAGGPEQHEVEVTVAVVGHRPSEAQATSPPAGQRVRTRTRAGRRRTPRRRRAPGRPRPRRCRRASPGRRARAGPARRCRPWRCRRAWSARSR